jgi:hypothetical protein
MIDAKKIESTNYLDPEFVAEIKGIASLYDANQHNVDSDKWSLAKKVNEMWGEHKNLTYAFSDERVFEMKEDYYVACTYQINKGLRVKRFGDSGQTLRRWCEVQETYAQFEQAELFLDVLSFEHLRLAKSISSKMEKVGKSKPPVVLLAEAQKCEWTASEMYENYFPYQATPPYIAVREKLSVLQDKNYYSFLKKREDVDYCIARAREIEDRIKQAIEAEGKATG